MATVDWRWLGQPPHDTLHGHPGRGRPARMRCAASFVFCRTQRADSDGWPRFKRSRAGRLTGASKAAMIPKSSLERSIAMDAATPKGSQTADSHSHLVHPDSMEWQQTRFPGCEAKTLLFDRATGLMTALMRAIFQVPNKFFEADGRVVDVAGQDWDEAWGHTRG